MSRPVPASSWLLCCLTRRPESVGPPAPPEPAGHSDTPSSLT